LVHRIVVEGGRAIGVEYEHRGTRTVARAEREVLVCAGAYGSPQLLMLSGIGPADHLRDAGVQPLVDSPNVGKHLQEHAVAFYNWHAGDALTLDDATKPQYLLQWVASRRGKLSSTIAEAVIHWRSDSGLAAPNVQIYFGPVYFWEHGLRKTGAPAISLGAALNAPKSRGEVRLHSTSAADHPRILNNLLTHDGEIEAMLR